MSPSHTPACHWELGGCQELAFPFFVTNARSTFLFLWDRLCLSLVSGKQDQVAWIASLSLMLTDSTRLIKAQQAKALLRPWGSDMVMEFHSWGESGFLLNGSPGCGGGGRT